MWPGRLNPVVHHLTAVGARGRPLGSGMSVAKAAHGTRTARKGKASLLISGEKRKDSQRAHEKRRLLGVLPPYHSGTNAHCDRKRSILSASCSRLSRGVRDVRKPRRSGGLGAQLGPQRNKQRRGAPGRRRRAIGSHPEARGRGASTQTPGRTAEPPGSQRPGREHPDPGPHGGTTRKREAGARAPATPRRTAEPPGCQRPGREHPRPRAAGDP